MADGGRIVQINIEDEMKSAYIDYSMSVIVARAIPDVRDGLKPVHRRVLFGMNDLGLRSGGSHKKSARVVGEVLGKYHPHGDTSVYDAMVRMAQEWSLRYPLVNGQGNFGSVDGDSPAAMRYTEVKMQKLAEEVLADIDKDTIDYKLNFDDTLEEPTVLPSRIPNLLVNGTSGIAVGMATNMLPHNLTEIVNGILAYVDNRDIDIDGLLEHVKAPDFPTGGTIHGVDGVHEAFRTGRGKVVVRGKAEIVTTSTGRERIIVTEIPYQVNKANMIQKAAELVNEKKIDGISEIRDESDRNGMRIVFELKRDAIPNVVLNHLYKHTQLQSSYGVNNICLVKGRPRLLNLRELIHYFVEFRHDVVTRRTQYELSQAEKRAHILEGYLKIISSKGTLDKAIAIIRGSKDPEEAKGGLIKEFDLSDVQARAILELRLARLTGMERDKIQGEYDELMKTIARLQGILDNEDQRFAIIREEMLEIKEKYGDERRTEIDYTASANMDITDFIPDEDVIITISHLGYIKRTSAIEYKVQNRGGTGSRGGKTRDEDFIEHIYSATNHNYMLFFTEKGRCFWMRVYEIPEGAKTSKGRAIQNLINLPQDDKVKAYIKILDLKDEEFLNNHYVIFCTKKGNIKKTPVIKYSRPRVNGINAITIKEGDELLEVKLTNGNMEIVIASQEGRAIRFNETKVRPMGRTASGVRGIRVTGDNEVVGMVCVDLDNDSKTIMVVSENGYGKRTLLDDPETGDAIYRVTNRGGKGVKTMKITDKTGKMIAIKAVEQDDNLMIINKSGIAIRMEMDGIRTMGRATQGVTLIRLKGNDQIASVAKVAKLEEEEVELDENGNPIIAEEGSETTENKGEESTESKDDSTGEEE